MFSNNKYLKKIECILISFKIFESEVCLMHYTNSLKSFPHIADYQV